MLKTYTKRINSVYKFLIGLQKISEYHLSYDPLHYILLFPGGDDDWHINIPLVGSKKRERITAMQFYSYRLHIRMRISFKMQVTYINSILLINMLK